MWPKKPDEKAEDFAYADDPEFSTIRRKLARWAADNVHIIKDLKPPQSPDFNNRLNANWKLLLQIAQHAGGGWPEQACRSAIYLSRAPYEPSVGVQLLAALRATFTKNRTEITSEQVVQELVADPDSPWHEYRGRGPITKNQVAALLRDYDIRPVVVHPTLSEPISRGTATGQRNSRTRSRASCPTSRTSEHSSAGARGRDVRCDTMIFVLSSFIRLSEPISRGTVTGQRNSRTRLRASCPTSRTSEHSRAGARRCDVRMFGCLSLNGPHREGGLLAGLRTYLPLSRQP